MRYNLRYSKTSEMVELILQNPLVLNLNSYTEEIWFRAIILQSPEIPQYAYFFTDQALPSLKQYVKIVGHTSSRVPGISSSVLDSSQAVVVKDTTDQNICPHQGSEYYQTNFGDKWNHVSVIYDDTSYTTQILFNGYLIPCLSIVSANPSLSKRGNAFYIAYLDFQNADLYLYCYRIWNIAKTDLLIRKLMYSTLKIEEKPNLLAYYKFDERERVHFDYSLFNIPYVYDNKGFESKSYFFEAPHFYPEEGDTEMIDTVIQFSPDLRFLGPILPMPMYFGEKHRFGQYSDGHEFTFELWMTVPIPDLTQLSNNTLPIAGNLGQHEWTLFNLLYFINDYASRLVNFQCLVSILHTPGGRYSSHFVKAQYYFSPESHNKWYHLTCVNYGNQKPDLEIFLHDTYGNLLTINKKECNPSQLIPPSSSCYFDWAVNFLDKGIVLGRRWDYQNYFPGYMREVRLWSRILCNNEIKLYMNKKLISKYFGSLVSYYSLAENAEKTIYDLSFYQRAELSQNSPYYANYSYYKLNISWIPTPSAISRKLLCKNNSHFDYDSQMCVRGEYHLLHFTFDTPTNVQLDTKICNTMSCKSNYDADYSYSNSITTLSAPWTLELWFFPEELQYMQKPLIIFEWDNNFAFGFTPTSFNKLQGTTQEIISKYRQYTNKEDNVIIDKKWHHIAIAFYMNPNDTSKRQSEVFLSSFIGMEL